MMADKQTLPNEPSKGYDDDDDGDGENCDHHLCILCSSHLCGPSGRVLFVVYFVMSDLNGRPGQPRQPALRNLETAVALS